MYLLQIKKKLGGWKTVAKDRRWAEILRAYQSCACDARIVPERPDAAHEAWIARRLGYALDGQTIDDYIAGVRG